MKLTNKNHFKKYGYTVLRNFFSKDEIEYFKNVLEDQIDKPSQRVFNQEKLWHVVGNKKLINIMNDLVEEKTYFLWHADSKSTSIPEVEYGWHRDNPCRQFGLGDDWDNKNGPYKVLRVGMYFQSFKKSKSSLNIFQNSHKKKITFSQISLFLIKRISKILNLINLKTTKIENYFYNLIGINIQTDPGDVIIFSGNMLHSATSTKDKKYAIFLTFGANNIHSENHINYYFYHRKIAGYQKNMISQEFINFLKSNGIFMDITDEKKNIRGVSIPK